MSFRSLLPFPSRDVGRGGDPFSAMQREINRMFDDVWRGGALAQQTSLGWAPSVDVNVELPSELSIARLPTRETTSRIERDANGNIVSSTQIEADTE